MARKVKKMFVNNTNTGRFQPMRVSFRRSRKSPAPPCRQPARTWPMRPPATSCGGKGFNLCVYPPLHFAPDRCGLGATCWCAAFPTGRDERAGFALRQCFRAEIKSANRPATGRGFVAGPTANQRVETPGIGFLIRGNWCPRRDSNSQTLRRRILNPLRLPFRHSGHRGTV